MRQYLEGVIAVKLRVYFNLGCIAIDVWYMIVYILITIIDVMHISYQIYFH